MSVVAHLARLQARIETVAENNSRPGKAGLGLDDTLAALDLVGRRRVTMMLEMIKAFSEAPEERAAAEHIWIRAARAWYGSTVSITSDVESRTGQRR